MADMSDLRLCVGVERQDKEPVRLVRQGSVRTTLLCGDRVVGLSRVSLTAPACSWASSQSCSSPRDSGCSTTRRRQTPLDEPEGYKAWHWVLGGLGCLGSGGLLGAYALGMIGGEE